MVLSLVLYWTENRSISGWVITLPINEPMQLNGAMKNPQNTNSFVFLSTTQSDEEDLVPDVNTNTLGKKTMVFNSPNNLPPQCLTCAASLCTCIVFLPHDDLSSLTIQGCTCSLILCTCYKLLSHDITQVNDVPNPMLAQCSSCSSFPCNCQTSSSPINLLSRLTIPYHPFLAHQPYLKNMSLTTQIPLPRSQTPIFLPEWQEASQRTVTMVLSSRRRA